jgi:hypothetical protein
MKGGWKSQQSSSSLFENPFDKFGMTYVSSCFISQSYDGGASVAALPQEVLGVLESV